MVSLWGRNLSTLEASWQRPRPGLVSKQGGIRGSSEKRTFAKERGLWGACSVWAGVADAMARMRRLVLQPK